MAAAAARPAVTRKRALRVLLVEWSAGAAALSLLMFAQASFGKFGPDYRDALAWLLNALAPTLSLLVTATLGEASARWANGEADLFRFRLAYVSSALYFLAIVGVILIEPFVEMTPFELFDLSGIPLAVWQALTVAAITAVIFDKR